jgi:hypothetical protein
MGLDREDTCLAAEVWAAASVRVVGRDSLRARSIVKRKLDGGQKPSVLKPAHREHVITAIRKRLGLHNLYKYACFGIWALSD